LFEITYFRIVIIDLRNFFLALSAAGYVRSIVREVWVNLENATDEIRMTAPRPHPLNPIDRAVHKVGFFYLKTFATMLFTLSTEFL